MWSVSSLASDESLLALELELEDEDEDVVEETEREALDDAEDDVEEVETFSPIVRGPGELVEEIYEDDEEGAIRVDNARVRSRGIIPTSRGHRGERRAHGSNQFWSWFQSRGTYT